MGSDRVFADAKDYGALFLKLGIELAEIAGLLGTARGIVLGVEIQYHFFPLVFLQRVHLSVLIGQ